MILVGWNFQWEKTQQRTLRRGIKVGTLRFFCPSKRRSNLIQLDIFPTGPQITQRANASGMLLVAENIIKG